MKSKCNQILIRNRVIQQALLLALPLTMAIGCQGKAYQSELPQKADGPLSSPLSLIETAEAPDSVGEDLWRKITSQFSNDLQTRITASGGKLVASAPSANASKTSLSINNHILSWRYFNQADYDQNGEVGLSDLTPIALNFGVTGPFSINSAKAIIDGDGNTEINLADITPIAVNFLASTIGGYNIYRSMDVGDAPNSNSGPNGDGAVPVENWPFNAATGDKGTDRLQFSFVITDPVVNAYYWVRPTDGETEGTPSNLVRIDPPPNIEPTAIVTATPDSGEAPLPVTFDGSGSNDPDGTIVDYSWDFNGVVDGYVWTSSGTDPGIEHTYNEPGTYLAVLQVTDDDGAAINSPVAVTVDGPPNDAPVANLSATPTAGDTPLAVAFDASLSDDPDGTIVKYEWDWEGDGTYDQDSGPTSSAEYTYTTAGDYNAKLMVTDNLGATDTDTVLISVAAGNQEWHISTIKNDVAYYDIDLEQINGKPAVAFSEPGDANQIYYFQGNDANGATWGALQRIGHVKVDWLTLVTTDGNPAVIYRHDGFFGGFVRALDADGDSWGTEVHIDPDFAMYTMVTRWAGTVVGGNPTLGYKGVIGSQEGLFYQSATAPEGTVWNAPSLAVLADLTLYPALHEVNGNPAMVFLDSSSQLNYVRATNSAGTVWQPPTPIDPGTTVYRFPEIVTVNGNPAILYPASGGFNSILNYVRATDADGSVWGSLETLYGNLEFAPAYPSIAVINGNPAAAWGGANPNDILYARANDSQGSSWAGGERVDIYFNSAVPLAEINGHPAIAYLRNGIVSADLMFAIYY